MYVFDTNSLSTILMYYYPTQFPSFWQKLDDAIKRKLVISVRECKGELSGKFNNDTIDRLLQQNGDFFATPATEEFAFIASIYGIPHFQQNLDRKKLLAGGPFADPFVIAQASVHHGIVVTEERLKENAARIPNICQHFHIECVTLEGFMCAEDWVF